MPLSGEVLPQQQPDLPASSALDAPLLSDRDRLEKLRRLRELRERLERFGVEEASSASPPPEPLPTLLSEAGRAGQIVASSLARGVATILGAPADLAELTLNAIRNAGFAMTGLPTPHPVDIPLGSEELIAGLPEALRTPQTRTSPERVTARMIQEIGAAALPTALSVRLLSHLEPARLLQLQAALASSAGLAAGVARELFPEDALREFIAELVGVFGPAGVAKLARMARERILHATGMLTREEVSKAIGQQLLKITTPEELAEDVAKVEPLQRTIGQETGGQLPLTTGQVSRSPELQQSERLFLGGQPQASRRFHELQRQQLTVIQDYVRRGAPEGQLADTIAALNRSFTRETAAIDAALLRAQAQVDLAKRQVSAATERIVRLADQRAEQAELRAQERILALSGRLTPLEAGQIIRQEYFQELEEFDRLARQRYADIPDFAFDGAVLQQRLAVLADEFGVTLQGPAASAMRKLQAIFPQTEAEAAPSTVITFDRLRQARNEVRRLTRDATAARDFLSVYQLGRLEEAIGESLDALKANPPAEAADALTQLSDVDTWYARGVARLKAGEAGALRFRDRYGRFVVRDEDVAAAFLDGETPFQDFVQALGHREAAKAALRQAAALDFVRHAVNPATGQIHPVAAARWVQTHDAPLQFFPELRQELADATQASLLAKQLRKEAEQLARRPEVRLRILNPRLFAELDDAEREHAKLLDLQTQTMKEWQKGVTGLLLGLDADRVAGAIVRNQHPRTLIAEVTKRIGTDPLANAGLDRALWDAALDRFGIQMTEMVGKPEVIADKMRKFLRDNHLWLTERFGAERVARMQRTAEALTFVGDKPVLRGHAISDPAKEIVVDWGPFFSRLFAATSGRVGKHWLIAERLGRFIGTRVKGDTIETSQALLEEAFFDPRVAQTLMLAARGANEELLRQRFRTFVKERIIPPLSVQGGPLLPDEKEHARE